MGYNNKTAPLRLEMFRLRRFADEEGADGPQESGRKNVEFIYLQHKMENWYLANCYCKLSEKYVHQARKIIRKFIFPVISNSVVSCCPTNASGVSALHSCMNISQAHACIAKRAKTLFQMQWNKIYLSFLRWLSYSRPLFPSLYLSLSLSIHSPTPP